MTMLQDGFEDASAHEDGRTTTRRRRVVEWLVAVLLPPAVALALIGAASLRSTTPEGRQVEFRENGRLVGRMSERRAVGKLEDRLGFAVSVPRELPNPDLKLRLVDYVPKDDALPSAALLYFQEDFFIVGEAGPPPTRLHVAQSSDERFSVMRELEAETISAPDAEISYVQRFNTAYYWFQVDQHVVAWQFEGELPDKDAAIRAVNAFAKQVKFEQRWPR